jgi:uncharacterized protein DUF3854
MSRGRSPRKYSPADHLDFLLSALYDRMSLHDDHLADLRKSSLSDETIALQKFRSVPPHMFRHLLGYAPPKGMTSGYVIPYYDIHTGTWAPFVRMKIFPPIVRPRGTMKYLQPRNSGVRIYFPVAAVNKVLWSTADLYLIEGEKKAACVGQTGVAVVGIAGCEGWHEGGSEKLHRDFDDVGLDGRTVHLWFDDDINRNPLIHFAADRLGLALKARGVKAMTVIRAELAE